MSRKEMFYTYFHVHVSLFYLTKSSIIGSLTHHEKSHKHKNTKTQHKQNKTHQKSCVFSITAVLVKFLNSVSKMPCLLVPESQSWSESLLINAVLYPMVSEVVFSSSLLTNCANWKVAEPG